MYLHTLRVTSLPARVRRIRCTYCHTAWATVSVCDSIGEPGVPCCRPCARVTCDQTGGEWYAPEGDTAEG